MKGRSTIMLTPHRRFTRVRAVAAAALAGAIGLLLPAIALAPTANAEAYRYWGYYHWENSQWAFAQTGPDAVTPADGAVEGWRFAITDESSNKLPRAAGDFTQICGSTEAAQGQKRVAIVIDYGTSTDGPAGAEPPAARGACAVVDAAANGSQILTAVSTVRTEGGLTCGIDGYPATGCGEPVATPPPAGSEAAVQLALPQATTPAAESTSGPSDNDGLPTGLLAGIGVVAVIGVAAAVLARRSRVS